MESHSTTNPGIDGTADTGIGESIAKKPVPILKLPNEILLQILGKLYNEDLVDFARTCRTFYHLGSAALREHQKLMRKWTTISDVNQPRGYLASRVARHLVDPRLANYTHCIAVDLGDARPSSDNTTIAPNGYMHEAMSDSTRAYWNEVFGPETEYWEIWMSGVSKCHADCILMMWASRVLVDIRQLKLYLNGLRRELLLAVLTPKDMDCYDPFRNLQSVLVDQSTIEGSPLSYKLLELCAQHPSVTELDADHITLDDPTEHPITSTEFVSKVESFNLERCYLGTRHLVALVSKMTSLDHFSYRQHCIDAGRGTYTDLAVVVNSLMLAATQTLTSLRLTGQLCRAPQGNYGSLEEFEALQYITLDFETFYRTIRQRSSIATQTRLPKSILWLKLTSSLGTLDTGSVKILLRALLWSKWERLSDLEDIIIVGVAEVEVKNLLAAPIVRRLETVGVEVTLKFEEDDEADGREEGEETDDIDG